ncbi:MAG: DMT family transporter [Alphaproteobacteria bacterium]|nr:DMT family transporter [Alphaproteobacteria bacterium]
MISLDMSSVYALGAAFSWCLASVFGHRPAVELGSVHFNRLRMVVSTAMLAIYGVLTGVTFAVPSEAMGLIVLSGLIGAAGGDYFLFKTMQRLGPRRTGVLFAANAPIAAVLGWMFLNEVLSTKHVLAIVIGFVGIVLAIIYGKRRDLAHVWENITPPLWLGVLFGMMAALGQAIGVLLMRPVMEGGLDPVVAGCLRTSVAMLVFWAILPVDAIKGRLPPRFLPPKHLIIPILCNGFFGLAFGVALLLKALETGPVGTVAILSATSPLMLLPFVWAKTRLVPPAGAWVGAVLVVLCSAMLVDG